MKILLVLGIIFLLIACTSEQPLNEAVNVEVPEAQPMEQNPLDEAIAELEMVEESDPSPMME